MDKTYDAIVVGAGNGGLSAAAFLAKSGKKVLVLEQNNLPGGCATSFVRGRFEFEASLHELCQMGEGDAEGAVRTLLESYGLDVDWVAIDEAFRSIVSGEAGYDVTMPVGTEQFAAAMEAAVPGSGNAVKNVLEIGRMLKDGVDWLSAHHNEPRGLAKLEMMAKYHDLMKLVPCSTDEILEKAGLTGKAKHIIESYWDYISADSRHMSFAVYCFMLYVYLTQKPWIARGRSTEIALAFDAAIRSKGGDIWYNCRVERIRVERGSVRGVELASGAFLPCNFVISNLMPTTVFGHMIDPAEVPAREKKLIAARTLGQQCFTVYLGLDIPYEALGFKAYDCFVRTDGDNSRQYENARTIAGHKDYCVTILNEAIPECSPPGTCIVQFSKFYAADAFADVTPENYFQVKDQIASDCVEQFEKLAGVQLRGHIEEIVVATPMTWARYLGTPAGDVYGYEPRDWDGMFPRVQSGHRLDHTIRGLRFCGGHGTQMDGYSQAYLSGAEQAHYLLEEMEA